MFFSATSTKVHLFLWLCFTLRLCTNNTFPSSRKNMHDVTSSLKQADSMKSLPSQKRHKAHYTIFYYLNWRHFTTDSDDDDCKTQLNCLSLCTDNLPVAQQLYHELHFWLCTLKGPVLSQVMYQARYVPTPDIHNCTQHIHAWRRRRLCLTPPLDTRMYWTQASPNVEMQLY